MDTSSFYALNPDDHVVSTYSQLRNQAVMLLADNPVARLLPTDLLPKHGDVARLDLVAAAGQLATALETLLLYEPGRVEQLEREREALEAKVREAEARSTAIVDDELRYRCLELLARPGRADTGVRDACVVLEDRLRVVAGLSQDVHGVDLVDRALNPKNGVLVFSNVAAEQQGIHNVYRGVIGFFRNPTSHRLMREYDLTRARQVVGLIDLLLSLLREAGRRADQSAEP
ncbi:MAG: TIGR02391 family protein [Dehalococcoidia bacterium]|nr:TIGR02391 family protein [Dehalococcoidia bacterium]